MNSTPTVIICAGAKGGQGTTTVAAVLALLSAREGQPTLLIDIQGDAATVLGVAEQPPGESLAHAERNATEVNASLRVAHVAADSIDDAAITRIAELFATGHRVIIDTGTNHDGLHRFDTLRPRRILVTRACYVALRRAVAVPFVPDHVALISEHQRSLTERDVSLALALPVTSVPYDPAIARAIDAGLLAARLPRCLAAAIAQLPV